MFKPLTLFIALRYMRAKRRSHFISFITLISVIGIALGVTVLITVLSVMNGFDYEIRHRIFGVARQVTIGSYAGSVANWQSVADKVLKLPGVIKAAPLVDGQGVMTSESGGVQGAAVIGVDPTLEPEVSAIPESMLEGSFNTLKPGEFNIILGSKLAATMGVTVGEKVIVMVPEMTLTPAGEIPSSRRFTVTGIFQVGNGFAFDSQLSFINLQDAQKLYRLAKNVSGIRLKLTDLYAAPKLTPEIRSALGDNYIVMNWTDDYGSFFDAIKLEKTMMFVMLTFIIAVAAFNLVATLVMSVTDKKSDIAILRTLGATPKLILRIFMLQGVLAGLIGTLLGLIGGTLLSLNATAIVSGLEQLFKTKLMGSSIYFVNYLPSKLELNDLIEVCCISLLLSLLATIYPAWLAARTQPSEALRYE